MTGQGFTATETCGRVSTSVMISAFHVPASRQKSAPFKMRNHTRLYADLGLVTPNRSKRIGGCPICPRIPPASGAHFQVGRLSARDFRELLAAFPDPKVLAREREQGGSRTRTGFQSRDYILIELIWQPEEELNVLLFSMLLLLH